MNLLKIRHQNLKKNEKFNTNIMEKNLYIDASHPDETRVVLKENGNIEDYEYEGIKNTLIKNNIYLGKVSRIEPSLQAAFVDFGRERHGFLSFNDIQSDYYQIPTEDKEVLKKAKENGNRIENGKFMFIYQANQSFSIWNNVIPKIDEEVLKILE